jgi:hypothetical protein
MPVVYQDLPGQSCEILPLSQAGCPNLQREFSMNINTLGVRQG